MRRWLRLGLIGSGGLAAAAVLAAGIFAASFDPNTQKDRIIEAARRATGRDLVLAGPLQLSLGWAPTVEAEDAALANRPGGSRPQMATVGRLRARVALLPLLSGRIEIESVTLDRPDILLETDAQGIGNWQFQRPAAAAAGPAAPAAAHRGTSVDLRRLVVENGRVTWRNGVTGRVTTVDVAHAALTLGRADDLVAEAQIDGRPVHVSTTLVPEGAGPWPVKLALDAAGARLTLDGAVALPLTERSYQGRVTLAAPDLAALSGMAGMPNLPPLRDVRLALALGADLAPQDITLHVGASDLARYQPGAAVTQFDLTLPGLGQPGRLTAEGSLGGAPWRLASGAVVSPRSLALRAMTATAGAGDLAGDVALVQGERWALRGTVVSQRLDLEWLRGLQHPVPTIETPVAPGPPSPPSPASPQHLFSDAPLPLGRLRAGDADLQFNVAALRTGVGEYRGVAGHLALANGALRVDPVSVQAPEGRVEGSLVLDASQPEPPVALVLRSAAFGLKPLLEAAGLPGGSGAPVEVDVALSSAGGSWHALAARLDGHVGLAMVDGAVPNAMLAAMLERVLPAASGRLDAGGTSAVRCLAVRLDAKAGQVEVAALQLDTSRLNLAGSGAVNLADETLALRLRPTLRLGGAGVVAPVAVDGALAHPVATLDGQGVGGRSGIVIGGAAPPDECGPALTLARDGHVGRLPAPAPVKAARPADLLRSFLR